MRKGSVVLVGCASAASALITTAAFAGSSSSSARATLRLADGTGIGDVRFQDQGTTRVRVSLEVPPGAATVRSFHGFHIHANDNPANGSGCQADPAAPSTTWFVSADGHLRAGEEVHPHHAGDMPSLHLDHDGRATATFTIDRIDLDDLAGRVVILHAGADNFGNVPLGAESTHYTPNSSEAIDRTRATGNAGDRLACGEIRTR